MNVYAMTDEREDRKQRIKARKLLPKRAKKEGANLPKPPVWCAACNTWHMREPKERFAVPEHRVFHITSVSRRMATHEESKRKQTDSEHEE